MKSMRALLPAAVAIMTIFVAGNASAFPLTLKVLTEKLTTTAYYGTNAATTTNNYTMRTFNLKSLMYLITNTVASLAPGIALPHEVKLAVDLYETNGITSFLARNVYLTNDEGFYFNLSASNLASFDVDSVVTKFKDNASGGGSEHDVVQIHLLIIGVHDQNFGIYEFEIGGLGTLNVNFRPDGMASMVLAVNGTGFGFDGTNGAGVCSGGFVLSGSGVVPANGQPYSVYWWNSRVLIPPLTATNPLGIFPGGPLPPPP